MSIRLFYLNIIILIMLNYSIQFLKIQYNPSRGGAFIIGVYGSLSEVIWALLSTFYFARYLMSLSS